MFDIGGYSELFGAMESEHGTLAMVAVIKGIDGGAVRWVLFKHLFETGV